MATTATTDTVSTIEQALHTAATDLWTDLVDLMGSTESLDNFERILLNFITRFDGHRVTSRSTSVVSNLVADVRRATVTSFFNELRQVRTYMPEMTTEELVDRMSGSANTSLINSIVR